LSRTLDLGGGEKEQEMDYYFWLWLLVFFFAGFFAGRFFPRSFCIGYDNKKYEKAEAVILLKV